MAQENNRTQKERTWMEKVKVHTMTVLVST